MGDFYTDSSEDDELDLDDYRAEISEELLSAVLPGAAAIGTDVTEPDRRSRSSVGRAGLLGIPITRQQKRLSIQRKRDSGVLTLLESHKKQLEKFEREHNQHVLGLKSKSPIEKDPHASQTNGGEGSTRESLD